MQAKQLPTPSTSQASSTKLDGTAKAASPRDPVELGPPVKVVGEGVDDRVDFDPREFAAAIFAADEPE
jgi:hypothetical protein